LPGPIGIERLGHVALSAPDPEAAAAFATERLGFSRLDGGGGGAVRLAAHGGIDEASLVYVPGDGPGLDHAAYVAPDLEAAAAALEERGVAIERSGGEVRFATPAGHRLALIGGTSTKVPVGHVAPVPQSEPAPVCADHLGIGAPDLEAEVAFAQDVLGMLASNHVLAPDGTEVMRFLRLPARYLYHQLVVARTPAPVLHHIQFTCKNLDSFYATADALRAAGVEVQWGPLRHGPGHNVALYVQDAVGHWIEYSVEEEIVLDDAHYVPRTWSVTDPKVIDEWNSGPPPEALMGPPPGAAVGA
jgi:catechol 2,3-dioxygenase-like lactoylglutathione lyase family enzyme